MCFARYIRPYMALQDISILKMGFGRKKWFVRPAIVLFMCSVVITFIHIFSRNVPSVSIKRIATSMRPMKKTNGTVKVKVDSKRLVRVQEASTVYRSQLNVSSCLAIDDVSKVPNKQIVRITYLCSICKQLQTDGRTMGKYEVHKNTREMRVFESFNIQLCKVPKTGCTFMSQVFKIIHDGVYNVFEMSREFAHSNQIRTNDSAPTFNILPTVLMARNPYSRLYSAYIDRIFLPPKGPYYNTIRKTIFGQDRWCERTPTFLQFLRYIINHVQKIHRLNIHWSPIHSLCNPCFTKNIMIIKHETYASDIDSLLEFLNASSKAKEKIQEVMKGVGSKVAVPGLIESQWVVTSDRNGPKQCLTKQEIVEMLWKSFQSQGYIRYNSTFPEKTFNTSETLTSEMCVKVFMSEIERNGPTLAESKAQRQKYLVEAYRNIPTDVLNDIKAIYREDFLLFDYDFDPPSD